jgi:hypothetical protein
MTESPYSVPNKGPTFMVVTGILCAIALALVLYRLINGWVMRKTIYKDDMLIAASMVFPLFSFLVCQFQFLTILLVKQSVLIVTTIVGDLGKSFFVLPVQYKG